METATTAIAS